MAIRERWKGTRPILLDTETVVEEVLHTIETREAIRASYLFGSRRRGGGSPQSDVDLAIQTDDTFTEEDLFDLRLDLSRAIGSSRIDVVWLNRADPVISFEVVQTGRCLLYRDPDELNEMERLIERRFWEYRLYLRYRTKGG